MTARTARQRPLFRPPLVPMSYEYDLFGSKRCTNCGAVLPANADYFHHDKGRADGLTSRCQLCRTVARRGAA